MTLKISEKAKQQLVDRFGGRLKFDEPMAGHTTFRVGGPADLFVMPETEEEIAFLITTAKCLDLPWVVIGNGSNILVKDRGIRGMVIALSGGFAGMIRDDQDENIVLLTVLAGTRLNACCRYALDNGLAGLNFALGIPGSVGGAILMNAGAAGGCMEQVVREVRIMTADARVRDLGPEALNWSYRGLSFPPAAAAGLPEAAQASGLPESSDFSQLFGNNVVLSGTFQLRPANRPLLLVEADEIMKYRRSAQPWDRPSAGCFFRNPPSGDGAGALIEQAGLKGVVVGDAAISEKHANFIVNQDKASADDIIRLSEMIQEAVYQRFGVALVPEVRILGE
jgi:UDP-N-acetylmuramate dehydrogenase